LLLICPSVLAINMHEILNFENSPRRISKNAPDNRGKSTYAFGDYVEANKNVPLTRKWSHFRSNMFENSDQNISKVTDLKKPVSKTLKTTGKFDMIPENLPRPKSSKKRISRPSSNIFGPPIIRPKTCPARESKVNKSTAFEQNVTIRRVKQKKSVTQVESSTGSFKGRSYLISKVPPAIKTKSSNTFKVSKGLDFQKTMYVGLPAKKKYITPPPTPVNNWCNGDSKKVVEKRTVKQTNTFRSSIFNSPSNMNNRSLSNNKKSVSSTNFSNSGCVIEDSGPVVYASNGINKLTELKGRSQCNNKIKSEPKLLEFDKDAPVDNTSFITARPRSRGEWSVNSSNVFFPQKDSEQTFTRRRGCGQTQMSTIF